MPVLLFLLGAGALALTSKTASAATTAVKFRLQAMQWQMHFIPAGGQVCGYYPSEVLEFATEAQARAALDAYVQKYGNPPSTFIQLLRIDYVPGQPFTEKAQVLAESGGSRNKLNDPASCVVR